MYLEYLHGYYIYFTSPINLDYVVLTPLQASLHHRF
jgi:hypothetical protein